MWCPIFLRQCFIAELERNKDGEEGTEPHTILLVRGSGPAILSLLAREGFAQVLYIGELPQLMCTLHL